MSRRTLLRSGAAASLTLAAANGLPAWAKPIADLGRIRKPGSQPFPKLREGEDTMPQVEHIVVLMMENHSFDNFFGMLPRRFRSRRDVDGLPLNRKGHPTPVNLDPTGKPVRASRAPSEGRGGGGARAGRRRSVSSRAIRDRTGTPVTPPGTTAGTTASRRPAA